MLWCIDNNTNIIQFNKNKTKTKTKNENENENKNENENSIINFVQFIYKNYKSSELLNMIVDLEIRLESMDANAGNHENHNSNEMLRTMRMTIVGGYS